jgi:hypothetical protein
MPDFAPDFTHRFIAEYVAAGVTHRILVRRQRSEVLPGAANDAASFVTGIFAAMNPLLPTDVAFTAAFWIPKDTDVSIPGPLPTAPAGTIDPADYSAHAKCVGTTFSAKDGAGIKGRFTMFGVFWDLGTPGAVAADGKVLAAENATVLAGIGAANGGTRDASIADGTLNFNQYVTVKVNDFLLKKARRGLIT